MRFEFDSISELRDFLDFAAHLGDAFGVPHKEIVELRVDAKALTKAVHEAAEKLRGEIGTDTPETVEDPSNNPPTIVDQHDVPAPVEQKRKRRTKAEMEAARAAEQAVAEAVVETVVESAAAAEQSPGTGNPFAQQELPAASATVQDVADPAKPVSLPTEVGEFITARLAERPEVNQLEHLNLARTFIGKHGMDKYNQSFTLAGLSNNVMGYSPADCARHAAALDFLSLE